MNNFNKFFVKENRFSIFLNFTIAILFFYIFISIVISKFSYYNIDWKSILQYFPRIIDGFKETLFISIASLLCSIIFGFIIYILKTSKILFLKYIGKIYSDIIITTPLLVQVIIVYYFVGTAFKIENRFIMGVLILSLFSGAFVSDIFKAGINSIDKNQFENANSLGFSPFQKYYYIILPQVIRRILPPLTGQLSLLIKSSSLLSIIAVSEITKVMQEIDSLTFATVESYLILAFCYFVLTYPISLLSIYLEKRLAYENSNK